MNLKNRKLKKSRGVGRNGGITIINSESGCRGAVANSLLLALGFTEEDFSIPKKGHKKINVAVDEEQKELLLFQQAEGTDSLDAVKAPLTGSYRHPMLYSSAVLKETLKVADVELPVNASVNFGSIKIEKDEEFDIDVIAVDLTEHSFPQKKEKVESELITTDDDETDVTELVEEVAAETIELD